MTSSVGWKDRHCSLTDGAALLALTENPTYSVELKGSYLRSVFRRSSSHCGKFAENTEGRQCLSTKAKGLNFRDVLETCQLGGVMLECYGPIFRTGVNVYDKGLTNEVIVFLGMPLRCRRLRWFPSQSLSSGSLVGSISCRNVVHGEFTNCGRSSVETIFHEFLDRT